MLRNLTIDRVKFDKSFQGLGVVSFDRVENQIVPVCRLWKVFILVMLIYS